MQRFLILTGAACAVALLPGDGWTQSPPSADKKPARPARAYPDHPIRLVVPAPSGGSVDVMARLLARQLELQLGQSIVVDNRGGANGIIGFDIVAKAVPDGYTLVSTASAFAIILSIGSEPVTDTQAEFQKTFHADIKRFAEIARSAMIEPQ